MYASASTKLLQHETLMRLELRTVIIVGNGFTRSFLAAAGCPSLNTYPVPLEIPLPSNWRGPRSPEVAEWEEDGPWSVKETGAWFYALRPHDVATRALGVDERRRFWQILNALPPATTVTEAGLTSAVTDASAEFRRYLWHYFARMDLFFSVLRPRNWAWESILHELASQGPVAAISYNYDRILERLFTSTGIPIAVWPFGCPEPPRELKNGLVIKPHGCIAFRNKIGIGGGCSDAMIRDFRGTGYMPAFTSPGESLPTIVPPGQTIDALFAEGSPDVLKAATHLLDTADRMIVVGISGAPPDDTEFNELFATWSPAKPVRYVGNSDTAITKVLRSRCSDSSFRQIPIGQEDELVASF